MRSGRKASGRRIRTPPLAPGCSRRGSCQRIPVTAGYCGLVVRRPAPARSVVEVDIPAAVTDRDRDGTSRRWVLVGLVDLMAPPGGIDTGRRGLERSNDCDVLTSARNLQHTEMLAAQTKIDHRASDPAGLVAVVSKFRLARPRIRIGVHDGGGGREVSTRPRARRTSAGW